MSSNITLFRPYYRIIIMLHFFWNLYVCMCVCVCALCWFVLHGEKAMIILFLKLTYVSISLRLSMRVSAFRYTRFCDCDICNREIHHDYIIYYWWYRQLLSVVTHSAGNGLSSSDLPQFEITWILLHSLTQVSTAVKKIAITNFLVRSCHQIDYK